MYLLVLFFCCCFFFVCNVKYLHPSDMISDMIMKERIERNCTVSKRLVTFRTYAEKYEYFDKSTSKQL